MNKSFYKKYQHNKMGEWLFKILFKGSIFLHKHPVIYWILQCTWGLLYNITGGLIALVALCFKGKPQKFHRGYMIFIGDNWGGFELGTGGLVANNMGKAWTEHTCRHEIGHCYQSALFGPITIFLITIPSAIRYWYRKFSKKTQPSYDAIWFEDNASAIGEYLYGDVKLEDIYPAK